MDDIDIQEGIARSEKLLTSRAREKKYIIKSAKIAEALDTSEFDTNEELLETINILAIYMQGNFF